MQTKTASALPDHAPAPFDFETWAPPPRASGVRFVGSATSHFQSEPLLCDGEGDPKVFSDWEYELVRKIRGGTSGIPQATTNPLPAFLRLKDRYIARSSELSENMFRLSFEFARLCPKEGEFNHALMDEYIRTLLIARSFGIEPLVTLYHFTMPKSLILTDAQGDIAAGAWEHDDVIQRFRFYVDCVVCALADHNRVRELARQLSFPDELLESLVASGIVSHFLTINEPSIVLLNSYLGGIFPPYKRLCVQKTKCVLDKLIAAHDLATQAIKDVLGRGIPPQVGIAHNWQLFEGIGAQGPARAQQYCMKRFERNGLYTDFIGLHYYCRYTVPMLSSTRQKRDFSDHPMFGDIYPEGILDALQSIHRSYPNKRIFVSEFGFSDAADGRRPYWILKTSWHILQAIKEGIPVDAVLIWTLVNNFEWNYGMSQKFGLFEEGELRTPLFTRSDKIRSWQAWTTAARALRSPVVETFREAHALYKTAYSQYKHAGGQS